MQAHCAVVSGACLAIGIRFAGSANAQAEAVLREFLLHFLSAKKLAAEPGSGGWCTCSTWRILHSFLSSLFFPFLRLRFPSCCGLVWPPCKWLA